MINLLSVGFFLCILLCSLGFYLICKGVNRNFDVLQIGFGWLFFFLGVTSLAVGIIHGDLVPKWLSVTENAAASSKIGASATTYRRAEDIGGDAGCVFRGDWFYEGRKGKRMTHTPGPWFWDGPSDNIHILQSHTPHIRICFLTSDGPTKANARLIAAAPDLLAALKKCVHQIADDERAKLARAAIAKAEGR